MSTSKPDGINRKLHSISPNVFITPFTKNHLFGIIEVIIKELRESYNRWNSLIINFSHIKFLCKGDRDEKII